MLRTVCLQFKVLNISFSWIYLKNFRSQKGTFARWGCWMFTCLLYGGSLKQIFLFSYWFFFPHEALSGQKFLLWCRIRSSNPPSFFFLPPQIWNRDACQRCAANCDPSGSGRKQRAFHSRMWQESQTTASGTAGRLTEESVWLVSKRKKDILHLLPEY